MKKMQINYTLLKEILNKMIPKDEEVKMPSFSEVINIKEFVKNCCLNNNSKNKLNNILIKFSNDKKNKEKFKINFQFYYLKIEKIFNDNILETYFGSIKVIKILKKNDKYFEMIIKKQNNINKLIYLVKRKPPIYKKI